MGTRGGGNTRHGETESAITPPPERCVPLPPRVGALEALRDTETGQEASRAAPVLGAMAGQGTREAMADRGAWVASMGVAPQKNFIGETLHLPVALWRRGRSGLWGAGRNRQGLRRAGRNRQGHWRAVRSQQGLWRARRNQQGLWRAGRDQHGLLKRSGVRGLPERSGVRGLPERSGMRGLPERSGIRGLFI